MDNQMFPGAGVFLDDVAQVCTLCGMMFNNALTYQHHMQLHILSANAQMLGTQPPPDPGIGMGTAGNILDLMGGVSQHTLSSGTGVHMVPSQAVISAASATSMPPHLISPGVGPMTVSAPGVGIPQPQANRIKEKKHKAPSLKPASSSTSSNIHSAVSGSRSLGSGSFKSQESSSSTYISTFPKDLQKMEHASSQKNRLQPPQTKSSSDLFSGPAAPVDPLEALILSSPAKHPAPGFERSISRKSTESPHDTASANKDTRKLFQPFVSTESPGSATFLTKSRNQFNADTLISPVKTGPVKTPQTDTLSTPKKLPYHSNNENLFASPPSGSSSDVRNFGMFHDSELASLPLDGKSDLPTKKDFSDKLSQKSQYFPDRMDPLNISPKGAELVRNKDIDAVMKMPLHQGSVDHSRSSSPLPRDDFVPFRGESALISPKVTSTLASSVLNTESNSLSADAQHFVGTGTDILPTASVPSTAASTGAHAGLGNPAIDIAVNPLGTGYFNALTQKFIDPTFSLSTDINKPGLSAQSITDDQKQKIYFENGVIMNQDYDKISDTNDEDNLERLIEDIDTKSDNNMDKGYSEIEDLLNEFNEKQLEDMKNKSQMDDFMKNDDFLKTVIEDSSKSKPETSCKIDDNAFNQPEEFEMNKSIISDILEKEKERIDKESTELENARLSGLMSSSTTTSTSVTVSSPTHTSTVTSVSRTEPKVSTSADAGDKKDDDHVDFEIPKVGKLMKIRKYFQIQEQKRKEQTEKVTEVRVHEKNEIKPPDDKPQTILVQVSKRKKIEYGPYLNRQSLLEGKPKANLTSTSPPKSSRPKPKPPIPEKRTFNLRERKTKTDFATLASTGSRTADAKKPDTKLKVTNISEPDETEKDESEVKEKKVQNTAEEPETEEKIIVTRSTEKKKEVNVDTDKSKNKPKEKGSDSETKQKDIKSSLRTRSAKNEADVNDGKNLRKRTIKPAGESQTSSKVKVKKTEELLQKPGAESEEKVTRSRSKMKTNSDKTEIKKCSVNLGEKYNESKAKSSVDKSETKIENLSESGNKNSKQDLEEKMEVSEELTISQEYDEANAQGNEKENPESDISKLNAECSESKPDNSLKSVDNEALNKGKMIEGEDNDSIVNVEKLRTESRHAQKSLRKGNKSRTSRRESNIFDKMDQSNRRENCEEVSDEPQIVSITSTDNTDKKVTMKLKLGPNFQKAFKIFNPKKRKHETTETEAERADKTEQKVVKKSKDIPESKSPKHLEISVDESLKLTETVNDKVKEISDKESLKSKETFKPFKESPEIDSVLDAKLDERFEETKAENEGSKDNSNAQLETDIPMNTKSSELNTNNEFASVVKKIESVSQNIAEFEQDVQVPHSESLAQNTSELKDESTEKKIKHSVENEFQRLVNEAMAEAQKEGETTKSKSLRKRMNENVKYNVDESDDELEKLKFMPEYFMTGSKNQKSLPKGIKGQAKSITPKGKAKPDVFAVKDIELSKLQQPKKDVDVYDFTDTEMSDSEESSPKKLGFKPKYVSNLNLFGQKKLPFVSKPMSPSDCDKTDNSNVDNIEDIPQNSENEDEVDASSSYVGKTVEPLKIKLSKIIPFKEKKHKHKKKKRKRDKEKREDDVDRCDSESRDSAESGVNKRLEDFDIGEDNCNDENTESKKIEDIKSVDSFGQESNSNSNEGDDDSTENGAKSAKRSKVKEKKHICEYCNVGFSQKCDLRRHVMIHTGERPYPCEICDKRFQRKTDLVKHTRTHTGEKPYACEFCDKRVSDKSQLNVHRRLHTGDRPYCCSKCGKRCITSSELSRHKAVHCGEKVERCNLCKKAFTVKECLGMHMKLHYRSRGKAFKCEKCVIGFDRKSDMDSHHCVDPMKNVYVCSECYEEFGDEMLYAEHIKTHDLGVLACNVCTNIFEDKHSLETHLCTLGEEKLKQLTCDICDTEFQDQDLLNQHMVDHENDEGSFICDLCPEIFTVRKQMIQHSRQHSVLLAKSIASSGANSLKLEDCPSAATSLASSLASVQASSQSSKLISSQTTDKNSKIDEKSVDAIRSIIKQEVDRDPYGFFTAGKSSSDLKTAPFVDVKTEVEDTDCVLPSNRVRASVISGTFRIDDEGSDSKQTGAQKNLLIADDAFTPISDKAQSNRTSSNVRSPDFLASDRFFESTDFSNSPDFSTLTDGDDLDLSPFGNISNPLHRETDNHMKMNSKTRSKQIDKSASLDLKQKIMKQFGPQSQHAGPTQVSDSRELSHQPSVHSLSTQNSQRPAFLSSETNTTSSASSSQINSGQLHRSSSTGHTSVFSNPQNNSHYGTDYQINPQSKRWPDFQTTSPDFVFSFLGDKKFDKSDSFQHSLSKSVGNSSSGGLSGGRSDMFSNKDNIENQVKSDMFPDFEITAAANQKSTSSVSGGSFKQNNFGENSSGVFQGINPNFGSQQLQQTFQEKDFASFGRQFAGPFTQTSPYGTNMNNRSMKGNMSGDSYPLDSSVTSDVNKRHLQGIYTGRSESLHNTSIYLSGVDDSIKDLSASDKDETTALLSNFDQF